MENIGSKMVELAQLTVPDITALDTHQRRQSGENLVILDIREPDETEKGYIEGAMLLPRGRMEGRVEELIPDKSTCIVAH
mgnify:CR=1 FL=1